MTLVLPSGALEGKGKKKDKPAFFHKAAFSIFKDDEYIAPSRVEVLRRQYLNFEWQLG